MTVSARDERVCASRRTCEACGGSWSKTRQEYREAGEEVEQKARCWRTGNPLRTQPCRVAEQNPLRRNIPGSAATATNLRDTTVHYLTIGLCLAPK